MNIWQNKKTGKIISRDEKYVFHPFFWELIGTDDTTDTDNVDTTDNDTVDDSDIVVDTTVDTDAVDDIDTVVDNTDDDSIISEILSKNTENNEFEDYSDLTKNADKTKTAYIGDSSYAYVDSRWRKVENG